MRKHIKLRLIELSKTILIMHNEILNSNILEQRLEYFSICQEASKSISYYISSDKQDFYNQIELLDDYCKEIFKLSQEKVIDKFSFQNADFLI